MQCVRSLGLFFKSNLGKQILFYSLLNGILWGFHLMIISLVSFFHLLLDHNIRVIGDWVGDKGWTLIIISKLVVFYLAIQFINLRLTKVFSIRSYFRNGVQMPRAEIIASLFFLLVGLMGLGELSFNRTMIVGIDRTLFSIFGTVIFFAVDYILLIVLDIFYPVLGENMRWKRVFILPALFYLFTAAIFVYEQTISLKLYAFFFLLLYAGEWRRKNWTLPALFLLVFLVPAFSLMGFDPVWGEAYSPLIASRKISTFSLFALLALAVGYLHYNLMRKPEHIYRD